MAETGTSTGAKSRAACEELCIFSFLGAAHALEGRLEAALDTIGSSLAKHGVLSRLVEAGEPLALSELAAKQSCVRSNITQLVDRLEAERLVERVADPADRRIVRAALTGAGRARYAEGACLIDGLQAEFRGSLSAADRAALVQAVSALE